MASTPHLSVVIVAGAPCSGKGTQCKMLARDDSYFHLSTGDLVRDLAFNPSAAPNPELAQQAKGFMDRGELVPDEIITQFVMDFLNSGQAVHAERSAVSTCLLDGFPRTTAQAEALLTALESNPGIECSKMVLLEAPDDELMNRAPGRRMDADGNIYNLITQCSSTTMPMPDESTLSQRPQDSQPAAFVRRLEVWHGYAAEVFPFLEAQNVAIQRVDASADPAAVHMAVKAALGDGTPSVEEDDGWGDEEEASNDEWEVVGDVPREPNSGPARMSIAPCDDLNAKGPQRVMVQIQVPSDAVSGGAGDGGAVGAAAAAAAAAAAGPNVTEGRAPVDVCCVVDVSASMSNLATYEKDGQQVSDGLTILNLVQHAVKTVMHILGPNDRLSLVTFNGRAKTIFGLRQMTDALREASIDELMALKPSGKTNIWDGLYHGMETLRAAEDAADKTAASATAKPKTINDLPKEMRAMVRVGDMTLSEALSMLQFDQDQGELPLDAPAGAGGGGGGGSDRRDQQRQKTLLLLTDGQPNISPPQGHIQALQDYKDCGLSFQINTFGFGYSLDSELLLGLAQEGNGTYAFIPDAVIVGTTFVNSIANVLSTLSQDATLSLIAKNGAKFAGPVLGFDPTDPAVSDETWGKVVKVGPLSVGQTREIVVPLFLPPDAVAKGAVEPYLEAVLTYDTPSRASVDQSGAAEGVGTSGQSYRTTALGVARTATPDAKVAELRCETVTKGIAAITGAVGNRGRASQKSIQQLAAKVAPGAVDLGGDVAAAQRLEALHADVSGRMEKALQGNVRFNRWGKHYLRALIRAHQVQLCTNFMDPGLQLYGGDLFLALKAQGDTIFLSLPPPKASQPPPPTTRGAAAGATTTTAAPAAARAQRSTPAAAARAARPPRPPSPDMTTYYQGGGGGCFGAGASVGVVTGVGDKTVVTARPISEVRAGDVVEVAGGALHTSRVVCVVEVARPAAKQMCRFEGGLEITPKHPVKLEGAWRRPRDVCSETAGGGELVTMESDYCVYNLVLEGEGEQARVLLVNGLECVTWGHGLSGDPVVEHAYWGSEQILRDLEEMHGWDEGHIQLGEDSFVRESKSGEVVRLAATDDEGPVVPEQQRAQVLETPGQLVGCLEDASGVVAV